jgi:hypothetical protein
VATVDDLGVPGLPQAPVEEGLIMWWSEHVTHSADADLRWWFLIVPGVVLWLRFGDHSR